MKLAVLALCAFTAAAAELAGTWTGQIPGRWGDIEDITFRFEKSTAGLSGKLYTDAESLPVRDLKVEGDRVTFAISTEMNGGGRRFLYSGLVRGDVIEISRRRELLPGETDPKGTKTAPQKILLKRLF